MSPPESLPGWSLVIARSGTREGATGLFEEWRMANPELSRSIMDEDVSLDIVRTAGGGDCHQVRLLRLRDCHAMEARRAVIWEVYQFPLTGGVSGVRCPACMGNITITPISESVREVSCPCGLIVDVLRGL